MSGDEPEITSNLSIHPEGSPLASPLRMPRKPTLESVQKQLNALWEQFRSSQAPKPGEDSTSKLLEDRLRALDEEIEHRFRDVTKRLKALEERPRGPGRPRRT